MTKSVRVRNLELGGGKVKICVPLTGTNREELREQARIAKEAGADLVEWRADFFLKEIRVQQSNSETVNLPEELEPVLEQTAADIRKELGDIPLLFTIRTSREGGSITLSQEEYKSWNLLAAGSGSIDLVDVEVFQDKDHFADLICGLQKAGIKVIASSHDFEKTDLEPALLERFQEMDSTGADILKMAVMPLVTADVAAIMKATSVMSTLTEKPLISMSMGETGAISRLTCELYGSCITFGTTGASSAPGQFPVSELKKIM